MCAVSMVHDHYQTWPAPKQIDYTQYIYPAVAPAYPEWTLERWNEYQELLRKAKEYDKRTGQADCPDPKKEKKHREIADYIEKRYGLKPLPA